MGTLLKSVILADRWQVSEPGRCSVLCGAGLAERRVICVQLHNGTDVEVKRGRCSGQDEPMTLVPCVVSCPFGWTPQNWSEVSGHARGEGGHGNNMGTRLGHSTCLITHQRNVANI